MRKAWINAEIWNKEDTAFLTEDEHIVLTGTTEEVLAEADKDTEIIDLHRSFVTPGFIDTHLHLAGLGSFKNGVQLYQCKSVEELLERIRRKAETVHSGWIIARGYNEEYFDIPVRPTRQMLDEVSRDLPIAVIRTCGHVMSVNSKAMELAGINETTTVEGGKIDFEHGFMDENALSLIKGAYGNIDMNTLKEWIMLAAGELNRFGITSCCSDDYVSVVKDWKMVTDAFMQLSYQGKLNVRVSEQCEFESPQDLASFLDEGYTTGVGDDYFQIGPLKMICDGSLGAETAAMTKDYPDHPGEKGILIYEDEDLDTYVQLANQYNMPAICHAIGDRTLDQVLNTFEKYVLPGNPLHYGIVHCQIMRPDQIQKVIDMNLDCYFQSLFVDDDAQILPQRVDEKLAECSYPYRTLFHHVLAGNGSDAPVTIPDALRGIYLAVTRRSTTTGDTMNPAECLTVDEAIASYTVNGAKRMGREDELGEIKAGMLADFTVMDKNLTKIPVEEILSTKILMTVSGGRIVYGE